MERAAMRETTIEIVKATAPVVKEHGAAITQRMYEIAFDARPDLRLFFVNSWTKSPEEARKQAGRLAGAVYAYAAHIDELDKLAAAVDTIAKKHVETMVIGEMYGPIGECLLQAMKDVLGDAATPEIMEAWTEAYGALADVFIKRERELYKEKAGALFSPSEAR